MDGMMEAHPVPQTSGRRKLAFSDNATADEMEPAADQGAAKQLAKLSKKSYEQMIVDAIAENDPRRKGVTFAMLQKIIKGKYLIEGTIQLYVKRAYEKLKEKKMVENATGYGFTGSIRLTKEHVATMKASEKLANKAKKTKKQNLPKKKKKTPVAKDNKLDKNNNNKKDAKSKKKPSDATPAKVNPKKTAITKTKIDRTGGKVRLSITTVPGAQAKVTKAKPAAKAKAPTKARAIKSESKPEGKTKAANAKKSEKDSKKPAAKK